MRRDDRLSREDLRLILEEDMGDEGGDSVLTALQEWAEDTRNPQEETDEQALAQAASAAEVLILLEALQKSAGMVDEDVGSQDEKENETRVELLNTHPVQHQSKKEEYQGQSTQQRSKCVVM